MADDEFEPLFDYSRVQPCDVVSLDDDSLDTPDVFCPKRPKLSVSNGDKKENNVNEKAVEIEVIKCDDKEDDEEDWLPPPPKHSDDASKNFNEDPTLKALRLKKQELASFQSAEEVMRAVEESIRKDLNASSESSSRTAAEQPPEPSRDREKIVISIQDAHELKQYRVYKDDKLERLFKMYASKAKLDVNTLTFSFDGDKINPASTPTSLDMEDDDIIEVHVKSK